MKIVVDLQGAQSESRHRGIGRYAKSMVAALADAAHGEHDIWVALNGRLDHEIESLRNLLDGLVPQERILSYALPGPLAAAATGNGWRRQAAELLRENFLRDLRADWVWHSSLFEGWLDDSATSTGLLSARAGQATTLYDLIPMTRPEEYLADPRTRSWYMRKIDHLHRQDMCFAISDWTRQEGERLLGLPAERIAIATCGVEDIFKPSGAPTTDLERQRIRLVYAIDKPFVFYMGGFDTRKNVAQLITAFGRLSSSLRQNHQLVIGGRISDGEQAFLRSLMGKSGISVEDAIFTGQIDDEELVKLYCHCALFVFPSLHEGFGLTVLEAMACGAPVLAANATSLPEVVGRSDMLFDPTDANDLAARMTRILADPTLGQEWSDYGKRRAKQFTWRRGADQMLEAFEKQLSSKAVPTRNASIAGKSERLRLAYISPLPPEPSGISDYSAELLPALADYYVIDVIVQQPTVSDAWIKANLPVRSVAWFEENAHRFDRVLYHFGNSPFHLHMFELLKRFPGTVVLHDSFLGGLSHWRSYHAGAPTDYPLRLYRSHGYRALMDDHELGREESMRRYPSVSEIVESSVGIIVHSRYSVDQARTFFGNYAASWMRAIAFPKKQHVIDKASARKQLGLPMEAFVVCSFGMLAPTKLNHRLLEAWLASTLSASADCRLVFVGENHGGEYGKGLTQRIADAHAPSTIDITGFATDKVYKTWLAAADVAVQLRTESRGETSAAVFDCLGYGLPLIVNAHATFNELPDDCVIKMADAFTDVDLVKALENIAASEASRKRFGQKARTVIADRHAVPKVAAAYRDTIEDFAVNHPLAAEGEVIDALAAIAEAKPQPADLWQVSSALVRNRKRMHLPCLLVDVTAVSGNDLKTGIERVTRNLARELMKHPPAGFRVEPVRLVNGHYIHAHDFATSLLGLPALNDVPEPVDPIAGDIFLGIDWVADKVPEQVALFQSWRNRGAAVHFMVYDLLPVLQPRFFPSGMDRMHARWLSSIATCADGLICISETVADELRSWLDAHPVSRERPLALGYSHIGADLDGDIAMSQLSPEEEHLLARLADRPTVLIVGTIEPRKGHQQVLDAFDTLWAHGHDINLVVVGKQGWMMDSLGQRMSQHAESGVRLFWQAGISDALLKQFYKVAKVLLVASEGEGFGLPLIEAAQQGIPVIARDLPVFREIAGSHATYFQAPDAQGLANAISGWLHASAAGHAPDSAGMHWLSWRQSAHHLAGMLLSGEAEGWLASWLSARAPGVAVPPDGLEIVPLMTQPGAVRFIDWGQPEPWGRWTLARRPRVQLRLLDVPAQCDLQVNLVANAFVSDSHPSQSFGIYANGRLLGEWTQHFKGRSEGAQTLQWSLAADTIEDGELEIIFVQEQSISPDALKLSADTRLLGLAVSHLSLRWIQQDPASKQLGNASNVAPLPDKLKTH